MLRGGAEGVLEHVNQTKEATEVEDGRKSLLEY